jgi:predicted nucleic acid-binding protein
VRPGELLALALRFGLSAYDAAYLELALRLQRPIATKDGPLRDAAVASGVGVVS